MKKSIVVILIPILTILCFSYAHGDNEKEFSKVINKFYDSVQAGDTESLLKTMTPDVARKVKETPKKAGALGDVFTITRQVAEGNSKLVFKDRQIKVLGKKEKTARVATKLYVNITNAKNDNSSELQSSDVFLLRRINDKWLIENLGERTD